MGGPDMAPHTPHTLGAPRRSRGAPRPRASFTGSQSGPAIGVGREELGARYTLNV